LQYLLFTMRVEMNRSEREASQATRGVAGSLSRHMLLYYVGTVILGLLVMQLVPELTQLAAARLGFGLLPIQLSVVAFINIHHYFIDNFIWKIRNPVVQRDLFAHLMPNR